MDSAGIEATELETTRKSSRMDPKLCPTTPLLVAFVSDADLWVVNVRTGREERLTFANNGLCFLVLNDLNSLVALASTILCTAL